MPSEIFRDHQGIGEPVRVDDFLGTFDEAPRLIERHKVQWVIGAMPESPPMEVARLVSQYAARVPHRVLTTGISDFPYLWQMVRDCGGQAGIEIRDELLMPCRQLFKRVFDVCAVLAGGLVISPLLVAIAFAVKLGSPGPVFYGQKRVGYGGKELTIWKFRTMRVNADAVLREYLDNDPELRMEWERTHKLQTDPRITRVGRFLRATSLDELPQLWNILRGEMSLVGPRPIVDDANYDREYVADYPEAYQLYLRVRPGITGLWQVAGRQHRSYYLRPQLDAYYVRNWSVWLDIFLLVRTVKTVLRREGAC
jgi:Undecaprenyl-phosphate galactose phosphotransferase WbaP